MEFFTDTFLEGLAIVDFSVGKALAREVARPPRLGGWK
jgi:hypothetical protein